MNTCTITLSLGRLSSFITWPGLRSLLCWTMFFLVFCCSPVGAANRELDAALLRGDHKAAITLLSKHLEKNDLPPKDRAVMLGQRGIEHVYLSEFDLAMQDYEQAIALQPKLALLYQMRGLTYEEMDQLELAITDFETVIRLSPERIMGYVALAWIYAAGRDPAFVDGSKALIYAQKAIAIKTNARTLNTLAVAQARNGQYQKAVATQQAAITMLQSGKKTIAPEILAENEERLALYQAGKPYTMPPLILPRVVHKKRVLDGLLHPE